jgi:preprotein translocase subunit SecD
MDFAMTNQGNSINSGVILKFIVLLLLATSLEAATIEFGFYSVANGDEQVAGMVKNLKGEVVNLGEDSGMKLSDIKNITKKTFSGTDTICITFNEAGALKNKKFTEKYVNRRIALVFGGKILTEPLIAAPSNGEVAMSVGLSGVELDKVIADMRKAANLEPRN